MKLDKISLDSPAQHQCQNARLYWVGKHWSFTWRKTFVGWILLLIN